MLSGEIVKLFDCPDPDDSVRIELVPEEYMMSLDIILSGDLVLESNWNHYSYFVIIIGFSGIFL